MHTRRGRHGPRRRPVPRDIRRRAASAPPPASRLRKSSGDLTLAPAIVGVTFIGAPVPSYPWGLDGGYHLARGRAFAMQVGAYFEPMPTPLQHVRLGVVGRFGGGSERVFGYALLRLGAALERVHSGGEPETRPGLHTTIGGGVMGMLHRVVGLGVEASAELLHGRTGPNFLDLRLLLALKF